ncbi:MAG: excinuclease ATPase subunit [Zoogloeaceae bacterium]|jgi:uncharacterized protein YbjQ (UPF0145 family)|nr:excinuclease ATPase subunit [Zoogloeaceae bacterium]
MMKKSLLALPFAAMLCLPAVSLARDTAHFLDFQMVVDQALADGQLDGSVKFYLKGQRVPGKISQTFPEATANKKTNAANKSDETACEWALRSVLISFQNNAKRHGANAVVDMVSFYDKKEYGDPEKFECHAGAIMAGVVMKGKAAIVK